MSLPVEELQILNPDCQYLYLIINKSEYSSGGFGYHASVYLTEHELRDGEQWAKKNGLYKIAKCQIF